MTTHSLSLSVRADAIPADGRQFHIEADAAERAALAADLGIPDVRALAADLTIRPLSGGAFSVKGSLKAAVVQTDVVTLEPVDQTVDEAVDVTLVPGSEDEAAPGSVEPGDADAPDFFYNGRIALGALTGEHLALGLDPYPRAPGVAFAAHIEDDSAASPFAALAKLKKDEE